MKTYVPAYYKDFACLMGDCRHSCCAGWEIDIDPDTLEYYRSLDGDIGQKLQDSIVPVEDGFSFRLKADQRCPFLTAAGLCELILSLGEDSLCQICADHPRFRNFFSQREEIGLGLCCEAAGRLILSTHAPFSLEILQDDGDNEPLDEEEAWLLHLRDSLIEVIQTRNVPMRERIHRMLESADICMDPFSMAEWASFLSGLEHLDGNWIMLLQQLSCMKIQVETHQVPPDFENAFEQLMVYLLYRHIAPSLEDGDLRGCIAFTALMFELVYALARMQFIQTGSLSLDDLVEIARMYSSEIEYSDENIAAILDELHRQNPDL